MATNEIIPKITDQKLNTNQMSPADYKETFSSDDMSPRTCAINDKSCFLESSSDDDISTFNSINNFLELQEDWETLANDPELSPNETSPESNTQKLDRNQINLGDFLETFGNGGMSSPKHESYAIRCVLESSSDEDTSSLKSTSSSAINDDIYIISHHSYLSLDSPETDVLEETTETDSQTNKYESHFEQRNTESSESEDFLDLCTHKSRSKTIKELINRVTETDLVEGQEELVDMFECMFRETGCSYNVHGVFGEDSAKMTQNSVEESVHDNGGLKEKKKVLKTVRQLNQLRKSVQ